MERSEGSADRGNSPAYDLDGWLTATKYGVSQEFCMDGSCWKGVQSDLGVRVQSNSLLRYLILICYNYGAGCLDLFLIMQPNSAQTSSLLLIRHSTDGTIKT